jgi:flavin reductase (DIM6/NTAB) family NADH-FMN oxidoreductase RutF
MILHSIQGGENVSQKKPNPPIAHNDATTRPKSAGAMRKIRSLFASGVTAVTTALGGRSPEGGLRLRGVTVSSFSALSLDPPLVLIALANETTMREMIAASGIFAINILSDDQEFLSERFAARAPLVNEEFEGVSYHVEVTGAPILEQSIAWYDCRVETTFPGGDHTVFVGRVEAMGFGDEARRPLVYFANRYVRLQK